jgi:hypothetical protein
LQEFSEGYGLQPVRKSLKAGTALAAEGILLMTEKLPSGAKARSFLLLFMYGLKPVPFKNPASRNFVKAASFR